ncbi:MAG TPA: twitching motility protein, partial [Chthoniobacterales bacterium]|nr:twitching motility protein [Chthoniobacterales bacterium]
MNKELIDALLSAMISSSAGVSDLLFAVGKPPIVEEHGTLEEFPIDTPTGVLDAPQIDQIAERVMGDDARLKADLKDNGSCDCSYALADIARLRVNIFKQNG